MYNDEYVEPPMPSESQWQMFHDDLVRLDTRTRLELRCGRVVQCGGGRACGCVLVNYGRPLTEMLVDFR